MGTNTRERTAASGDQYRPKLRTQLHPPEHRTNKDGRHQSLSPGRMDTIG